MYLTVRHAPPLVVSRKGERLKEARGERSTDYRSEKALMKLAIDPTAIAVGPTVFARRVIRRNHCYAPVAS